MLKAKGGHLVDQGETVVPDPSDLLERMERGVCQGRRVPLVQLVSPPPVGRAVPLGRGALKDHRVPRVLQANLVLQARQVYLPP